MSGLIERLTEGVVNRDMRAESHALLKKWQKTGLLEGLTDERQKHGMARLLENQAKELLRESNSMGNGQVEGFATVAFPIVRRVFAGLIANDLVSVQPMSLPSGLIFFLDFTFSANVGDTTQNDRFGNLINKSIYGTDKVGSGVIDGVSLVGANAADLSGPRSSARGYAYASATGSVSAGTGSLTVVSSFDVTSSMTADNSKLIDFDPDLLALAEDPAQKSVLVVDMAKSLYTAASSDFNNLSAFAVTGSVADLFSGSANVVGASDLTQIRRLTKVVDSNVRLVFVHTSSIGAPVVVNPVSAPGTLEVQTPIKDTLSVNGAPLGAIGGYDYPLEGNANIPEIDIKVDSTAVTAQTKKLKAKWTPELGQDLNAYHNLDAEVELTQILSEQIALEIDREILADLVNGATAGTYYWSRSPGMFLNRVTGAEIGASAVAPDFTGTVSEWYETLVETINDVSAQIHRKTLRGGANFCVMGPEMANILEFTSGFRANVTHEDESGSIGAVKAGSLSKKFDVIVDPYFLRNVILVGRRGSSFLESGYVYAPYVPLQTTPTIFGPEDFVPRKGVMTRYAKKMVRPDMYGLVVVRGMLGESGS